MDSPLLSAFYINHWLIQPECNQISDGVEPVRLPPKFIQVLCCLAEQAGTVVTRDALLDAVWGETVVGEAVLTRAISELRKVFHDDPQHPQVIETIPKRGYRLVTPVVPASPAEPKPVYLNQRPSFRPNASIHPKPAWILPVLGALTLLVFLFQRRPEAPEPWASRPLTSYQGDEFDPALSPNGEKVALVWRSDTNDQANIFIKDIASEALTRFTNTSSVEGRPTWSPDGRFIAFARCNPQEIGIYLKAVAGGPEQKLHDLILYDCKAMPDLAWSPDGTWLAFTKPSPQQGIYAIAIETQAQRRLTASSTPYVQDRMPAFSPNGRQLAFVRSGKEGHRIYLMNLDDATPRPITPQYGIIDGLDWTPDGKHLVFASQGRLWRLPLVGGSPEPLQTSQTHVTHPSAAHQSGRLVHVQSNYEVNIWQMRLTDVSSQTTSIPNRLIASTRIDGEPRISPDGTRIAFVSDRAGSCSLWMARQDGSDLARLTTLDNACMGRVMPRWSPDGRHLALISYPNGHGDVFTINVLTGKKRRLTVEASEEVAPSWSKDGRWLYFGSNRSGDWQIWRILATGGRAQQITKNGGYVALESKDCAGLYFTKRGQAGLWYLSDLNDYEVPISDMLHPKDALNWHVTKKGIYYIHRPAGASPFIAYLDTYTGQVQSIAEVPAFLQGHFRFDIAPDAQWALFAHVDHGGQDLVLIENVSF